MIDEIFIPEDLNEEQARKYLETMEEFKLKNANKEEGRMGSYCLSGQQYFAYQFAKGLKDVVIRKATYIDGLTVL